MITFSSSKDCMPDANKRQEELLIIAGAVEAAPDELLWN